MADRIIKGDSGNDVVIQNNGGSRKIEVTDSGDVEVTGDFKTTTVKATNIKANDGTTGLVVADSTGEVTSSGGVKAVNVKTTNLKANDGTAGISIADSTGRVTFSENNPVVNIGSNATFRSEFPTFIKVYDAGSGSGLINSGATNNMTGVNFGSTMSFTFPASSTAVIQSIGGTAYGFSTALYLTHLGHAYKSGSDFSNSTDGSFLWSGYCRQDGALTNVPASASTILTNTGSEATYYIRLAVKTHNDGYVARWDSVSDTAASSDRNRIVTTIMVYKT